ncbi:MAG: hypothetical protein ACI8XB_000394 [Patiriisocius sp.]|jgi:hypothetical protein
MKVNLSIFIVTLFLGLTSCVKDHVESGDIETEFREVAEFEKVILEGSMDIVITQDETYDLKVVAGENKMPFIKTKVTGNTLRVYEKNNHVHSTNHDKVYISKSYLSSVTLDGSGDIDGGGLFGDDIDISIDGSGDITLDLEMEDKVYCEIDGSGDMLLTGTAEELELELNGSGSLDARHFPVNFAYIMIHGSGEARVHALELLDVSIQGSGDVYYVGSPGTLTVDINGSGGIGPL